MPTVGACAALLLAAPASAAVTSSSISSPTSPSFQLFNADSPNTLAVSGTTDSTAPGADMIDLKCFSGDPSSPFTLKANVDLNPGGSFTVSDAIIENLVRTCTLRAVPAGSTVDDPSFTGPVLAAGEFGSSTISGGPNDGTAFDYYVLAQQLSAANDYLSMSSCGYCDGYLHSPSFAVTAVTFALNDYFGFNNYSAGAQTRSPMQVDGANAYTSNAAAEINQNATPGFPVLTYSLTQNPANGNATINESSAVVKCPDTTYPPTVLKCPSYVSTGVRADRTITQTDDGHLVTIADTYVSTDGQQHTIDLQPENLQSFGQSGANIEYRFPGETGFSTHAAPSTVPFSATVPGTTSIRVMGSPDPSTSTGYGAIVSDRPGSPASFNHLSGDDSAFYFQQTAMITADCSPSFRFAYAQDYTSAAVVTLAQSAATQFAGLPSMTCSESSPSPTPSTPTAQTPQTTTKKKCKKGRKLKKGKCVKKKRKK